MADEERFLKPERLKKVNAAFTLFWLVNLPVVIGLYIVMEKQEFENFCLFYLALVSIWALVAAHFTAYIEGRVEVKQREESSGGGS